MVCFDYTQSLLFFYFAFLFIVCRLSPVLSVYCAWFFLKVGSHQAQIFFKKSLPSPKGIANPNELL